MLGVDPEVLDNIDPTLTLGRIINDLKSDFIYSPHYIAIFKYAYNELWDQLKTNLRNGTFEPDIPITIEVPKQSGLTRPGSILKPADRFIYQALIDVIAPKAEENLDRNRVFSNVLIDPDPEFRMFEDDHTCWTRLQEKINNYCEDSLFSYAIRADVANFFERLYQHVLINLLRSSSCPSGAINLLEQLLLSWTERKSYGILQGMFPSDFLGNYYLVGIDSDLEVANDPSARYVDDLYIFYSSERQARIGMTELCRSLRKEGLHLNERKSSILKVEKLLYEETQLDRMFEKARAEVKEAVIFTYSYGMQSGWPVENEIFSNEQIKLKAVEALYRKTQDPNAPADSIERFCLPILAVAGSQIAVKRALEGVIQRPHMAKHYCSYLWPFLKQNPEIGDQIESVLLKSAFTYEWQLLWPIAALLNKNKLSSKIKTFLMRLLQNHALHEAVRAICAILIGKHGSPGEKQILVDQYSNEHSDYVRSAILYATKYFTSNQRSSCLRAWGGHSRVNALVANAVRKSI